MTRKTIILVLILAVTGASSGYLSYHLERMRPESMLEDPSAIASPKMARYMSLGYTGLTADIYWTRAVQYFGGKHHARSRQYQSLEPLLTLTTELDPQLLIAYYFGSFFLAQKPPEGAGDPDAAVRLVERGIKANPDQWRLYYHLGMIHYTERHDFNAASEAFERGAQNPKALPFIKVMAAAMRQRSGDINTARYLWTQILENTDDKLIKDNAIKHLASLRVDEDVSRLEQVVTAYKAKTSTTPNSWRDLINAGYLRRVPTDPTNTPYVLRDGKVEVQGASAFPFIERGRPGGQSVFDPVR
jgi:tetratricopeptide (TPR) repeat protein